MRGAWIPPSDELIAKYRDELYPKWLEEIRNILEHLHETLAGGQTSMVVGIALTNVGTRPAVSAEVRIGAQGPLWMSVDATTEKVEPELTLPSPPASPKGQWEIDSLGASLRSATAMFAGPDRYPDSLLTSSIYGRNFPSLENTTRDPHAFYWGNRIAIKENAPVTASCSEWRHAEMPEEFWIKVEAATTEYPVTGAMHVEVHAGNLSDPIRKSYAVTINAVEESCICEAERLVNALIQP